MGGFFVLMWLKKYVIGKVKAGSLLRGCRKSETP